MRKVFILTAVLALLCVSVTAQAGTLVWSFTNTADYYTNNAVVTALPGGGGAYVAPLADDEAAVFARINTLGLFKVGDITGGGFTLSGMNHPDAVYGSLYLSPTGGGGSDVLILLSPMSYTGTGGSLNYTFDLNTHADYRTLVGGDWTSYDPSKSGTFGDVIGMINVSSYSSDYAAFFGPQIGMSGTSATTFTVSEINLSVPEPSLILLLGIGFGAACLVGGRKRI